MSPNRRISTQGKLFAVKSRRPDRWASLQGDCCDPEPSDFRCFSGYCSTGLTLSSGVLSQGHLRFSQVSCESLVHLPCSQTPVGPPRQADYGVSVLPPHKRTTKAPAITGLSKLNHTAFALAVYASCRPLGRRRKTRFRWLAKPFRVGFYMPTEFVRRVSAVASPLPGLILARLLPPVQINC